MKEVRPEDDAERDPGAEGVNSEFEFSIARSNALVPLLTIFADFVGILGGFLVSYFVVRLNPAQYWARSYNAIEFGDALQGIIKPFVFGFIISTVGCYFGLTTRGGTQGVGRATTEAVVVASVLILVANFFVAKFLLWLIAITGW